MAEPTTKIPRRPFPQINAFRPFVIDELRRRKSTYPNPISAPFVRLTSCKHDPANAYIFFSLGLHGYGSNDSDIFDPVYGGGRDVVGYAADLNSPDLTRARKRLIYSDNVSAGDVPPLLRAELNQSNPQLLSKVQEDINRQVGEQRIVYAGGAHPIPGITSVQVKRSGIGTPLIATIQWSCYNRAQLEFLRNHFMVAGGYCVIEFGQNFHDRQVSKVLDFQNVNNARQEIANSILKGRKYIIDNYVEPNSGNYDFLCGVIGNYQVDLDAKTGIYNCSTTLVSVGEEMWGLTNNITVVKKDVLPNSDDILRPNTFHDFFRIGGTFDEIVESCLEAGANGDRSQYRYVAPINSGAPVTFDGPAFNGVSTDSRDYRFVSWEFFCLVMIPRMMELIQDQTIKEEVQNFISFYVNQREDGNLPEDEQAWVGNHKDLRSTDPDIMLLIKSDMSNVPPALTHAGNFDDFVGSNGFRGKLSKGVWLNTGMIRTCFLQTLTFQQAIKSILIRLNSATVGFWNLQLFFDDEVGKYKIIDVNLTDGRPGKIPAFYKFNTAGKGELLNINFDSAFPPELVTQMMLYAKFRTETQQRQEELLSRYPAIGTTSTFALALNWTSLVDVVQQDIDKARENVELAPIDRGQVLLAPTQGPATEQVNNTRTANRVMGADATNIGAGVVSSRTNPAPGTKQSTTKPAILPENQANSGALGALQRLFGGPTRNSAKPTDPTGGSNTTRTNRPKIVQEADKYKVLIEASAKRWGVDPNAVRACIATESLFNPNAYRNEPRINDGSYGLMQILYATARGLGFRGTPQQLFDPANNIEFGTRYLASRLTTVGGDIEDAISAYNGGFRPNLAFGRRAPADGSVRVCTARDQKTGNCIKYYTPAPGQYGNQGHVNRFMGYYQMFRKDAGLPPYVGRSTQGGVVPTGAAATDARNATPFPSNNRGALAASSDSQNSERERREQEALDKRREVINERFKNGIVEVIALSPSVMRNLITRDGYRQYPNSPNGFVCPFPTNTSVEVQLQGISGISISDGFYVDRLPFIFERYGIFQVTQTTDNITSTGWVTTVRGYFKMVFLNGEGPSPTPVT